MNYEDMPKEAQLAHDKLEARAQELGIVIGGCGCCGSPWLKFEGEYYHGKGWLHAKETDDEDGNNGKQDADKD